MDENKKITTNLDVTFNVVIQNDKYLKELFEQLDTITSEIKNYSCNLIVTASQLSYHEIGVNKKKEHL